ncbi:SO_0444 family Cu/Zn efflux transporter [bacterium]|nr:SO_0444 family Cu/Zn efflux transporter [bacterium]
MDFSAFTYILHQMSPYLLFGFFVAGLLHVYVPKDFYHKYLGGNNAKSVILSALFGVPLPLCSCGVIPTAVSLQKEGASKGATVSFLISTPQTGVDSIIATYSLMGLPFAVIRPLAAFVTAIFGGFLTNAFQTKDEKNQILEPDSDECCCHDHDCDDDECCCHHHGGNDHDCCGHEHEHGRGNKEKSRIRRVFEYGFSNMIGDVGKRLVFGLVAAGLITVFVPDTFFTQFANIPVINMLAVLVVAVPMYICATGSIPIAVALMIKGMTPGAALVMLMAGPAVNAASILVVGKAMGRKTLLIYLISIVAGAVAFGFVVDYALPREWFTAYLPDAMSAHHHGEGASWWEIASSVVFVILLVKELVLKPLLKKFRH